MSDLAAVVTAAGDSRRWASQGKKEYVTLRGRPVLAWAIEPFLDLDPSLAVAVTVPEPDIARVKELLQPFLDGDRIQFVAGGGSRQESVYRALEALGARPPAYVLIHDGARPWVSLRLVERVIEGARKWGACVPVLDASEAPKRLGPSGLVLEHLQREELKLAQTPQGFLYSKILTAHRQACGHHRLFVDDGEVYAAFAGAVFTVAGERINRKITFKEDLETPCE